MVYAVMEKSEELGIGSGVRNYACRLCILHVANYLMVLVLR